MGSEFEPSDQGYQSVNIGSSALSNLFDLISFQELNNWGTVVMMM